MLSAIENGNPAGRVLPALLILVVVVTGCGSGGSSVVDAGPAASMVESGTAPAANLVRMTGEAAGDLITLRVNIGGPTGDSDLYSFAFDLVLGNATVAEYVDGSASFGSALTLTGGQGSQVLAVQQGDRITVGVSKLGGGSGNGIVAAGEAVIVELVLRVLAEGTTTLAFEGSPPHDPSALDSEGDVVGTIAFDGTPVTLVGS